MHSIFISRAQPGFVNFSQEERDLLPPTQRPIVRQHPGSERKTLYLASHIGRVVGQSTAEDRLLVWDLIEHATQPQFIYTHSWSVGDTLIWDNRCTMHGAMPFDLSSCIRDMCRATVIDMNAASIDNEAFIATG